MSYKIVILYMGDFYKYLTDKQSGKNLVVNERATKIDTAKNTITMNIYPNYNDFTHNRSSNIGRLLTCGTDIDAKCYADGRKPICVAGGNLQNLKSCPRQIERTECGGGGVSFCGKNITKCPAPKLNPEITITEARYSGQTFNEEYGIASCTYKIDALAKYEDAIELYNEYENKNIHRDVLNKLMLNYAFQETEQINVPSGFDKAVRLYSSGDDGKLCRKWRSQLTDQELKSLINPEYVQYCSRKKNELNKQCSCINATKIDPLFAKIQNVTSLSQHPECWYSPCMEKNSPNVFHLYGTKTKCPENLNVCQNVINVMGSQQLKLNNINPSLNCGRSNNGSPANGSPDKDDYTLYIIITIIVIVIVIIGLIIYFKHNARKS